MKKVSCLEVNQPMGTYYVSKLSVEDIAKYYTINRRSNNQGIQRALDNQRKKAITDYCNDPDAIFPTPIIFSIKSTDVSDFTNDNGLCSFNLLDNVKLSVVDGQHRICGILDSRVMEGYELPVVFMFDITEEEEAYVFSTINFNQKMVDKSLIYDLFGVYKTRSPQKTCHEVAKALNDNEESPFYKRLKVLGKKESSMEFLSQGTFVYHLLPLICPRNKADSIAIEIKKGNRPQEYSDCIFNAYFMNNEDGTIYTILFNYFTAVKNVFFEEWNNEKSILTKTAGYGGLMMALPEIFEICKKNKVASIGFFEDIFERFKELLEKEDKKLTADFFGSGASEQRKLADLISSCLNTL